MTGRGRAASWLSLRRRWRIPRSGLDRSGEGGGEGGRRSERRLRRLSWIVERVEFVIGVARGSWRPREDRKESRSGSGRYGGLTRLLRLYRISTKRDYSLIFRHERKMTAQIAEEDLEQMLKQLINDLVLPPSALVARIPMTLERV